MHSIGDLSRLTGVKVPTIRYYESVGLIPEPRRSTGNQRRYNASGLQRLTFIKHARDLGLPLSSVRDLLELSDQPELSCEDADRIAAQHLVDVQQRIQMLQNLETELQRIVAGCESGHVKDCYVIRSLADHGLCQHSHQENCD